VSELNRGVSPPPTGRPDLKSRGQRRGPRIAALLASFIAFVAFMIATFDLGHAREKSSIRALVSETGDVSPVLCPSGRHTPALVNEVAVPYRGVPVSGNEPVFSVASVMYTSQYAATFGYGWYIPDPRETVHTNDLTYVWVGPAANLPPAMYFACSELLVAGMLPLRLMTPTGAIQGWAIVKGTRESSTEVTGGGEGEGSGQTCWALIMSEWDENGFVGETVLATWCESSPNAS
jgi:hypothetical protein